MPVVCFICLWPSLSHTNPKKQRTKEKRECKPELSHEGGSRKESQKSASLFSIIEM